MTTLSDMIQTTLRRASPGQQTETLQLNGNITFGATSITVSDPAGTILPTVRPEQTIAIDLELFYVQAVVGLVLTVVPGYLGSRQAAHTSGALVYINPRFSQFDVMSAINDDLLDLSAQGLYQVKSIEITYNPATAGYDLVGLNYPTTNPIISVQQKIPYPVGRWDPISRRKWTFTASADTTDFASGYALRMNYGGYPGMPMRVTYKAQFSQFNNLADDATTVAGLPPTMYDLPPLGAMIAIVAPREIKRNQIDSAPDSRRGTEVPPGAVMSSVGVTDKLRTRRIIAEATRLQGLYGQQMGI